MKVFDRVRNHPTIRYADREFAYGADKEKPLYRLDERKNLLDLETGERIGQALTDIDLLNTPGYPSTPQP
jgi:hypothetical protein